MTADSAGILSIVATPIGNREDITLRALAVLSDADLILAEDTRHSRPLLTYHGITTPLKACHEHNEESLINFVAEQLDAQKQIALISDAGTPLISDPGFVLVRSLRARGYTIVTVPGASAVIAGLSVSGLPTDEFFYGGFLPTKTGARKARYEQYKDYSCTTVCFESSHRIIASLIDLVEVMGPERGIVIARELTKRFETVISASAAKVLAQLQQDSDQCRGEFVLLIKGAAPVADENQAELTRLLETLLTEVPLKTAVKLAAKITGERKNAVYELGVRLTS